ncbi:MAG: HDOD domain-containing protein [candidate division Zixibacteria bacterium]|nr:HDOD domain-containing protein [candidate division Zixibacteria bacterium]
MPEMEASTEKKIKTIINRIHNLPTPPMVFTQVNKAINNPDTSAYQLGAIISEDPALTAKILKLTNSAFYGIPRSITSVKQAIIILGLDVVRSLVLSASVFETFSKLYKLDKEYLDAFWRHSLSVGFMSRIISRTKNFPSFLEAEESFSAGLLHDIGKLVIFTHMPSEFITVKQIVKENPEQPICEIENEIYGFDHTLVGNYLAQKWNLPYELAAAILYHHKPDDDKPDNITTWIIHMSDYLSKISENDDSNFLPDSRYIYCSQKAWQVLGLRQDYEEQLIQLLRDEYMKAETFINMARGEE